MAAQPVASVRDGASLAVPVEELERIDAPEPAVFVRRWVRRRRPVVLRGVTEGWLPPERWTTERMASEWGAARVIAAVLADGTLHDDSASGVVFGRVAVRELIASFAEPGTAGHYVMAPTTNFPSAFARDYRVPRYCEGAAYMRAKVWIGKGGTVTPMHRDVPHNLHVHLTGRKRWLLFPPGGARMYSRGLLSGMPNFSQVDPERPDYERFPRFRGVAAVGGVIQPGETLFIPRGWWHHTRTLDDAVSMNFWWGGTGVRLTSLASTAFKRVRGIRRDEWAER
ncbi:MAG TPA: cupin-like domain-containing protein [Candidatus Binatia bacterium]|nr:cupin-like domain-containing protein [Candidatus Binatia bacterium]